jgi:HEAT repeat protein
MFGPFLYTALILAIPLGLIGILARFQPLVSERREIESLAGLLRSRDPALRERSARLLAQHGSTVSLPFLLEAAQDPRGDVRATAYRSLVDSWSAPQAVIPVLVAASTDQQDDVREAVVRGLGRAALYESRPPNSAGAPDHSFADLRADTLNALRRLLKDQSSTIRAQAAESLAGFGGLPETKADLIAALGDQDRDVRLSAARVLCKIDGPKNPAAVRTLLALLTEPEVVSDRREVLELLGGLDTEIHAQAIAALVGLLSHNDDAVRSDVIDCLLADGPRARAAVPALNHLLKTGDPRLRASAGLAIVAIEGQKSPIAVDVLLQMIGDSALEFESRNTAVGMVRHANPAALSKVAPDLIRQLGSNSVQVRQNAVGLLAIIIEDTKAEMPVSTRQP